MFHILPYMMYLKSLVKILLPVMDLNMANKIYKTSKYTGNSDFRKTRENFGFVQCSTRCTAFLVSQIPKKQPIQAYKPCATHTRH